METMLIFDALLLILVMVAILMLLLYVYGYINGGDGGDD